MTNAPDCAKDLSGLEKRIRETRDWLKKEAPECFSEQKHTEEGTQERIYWHHGYMMGLKDALRFLTGEIEPSSRNADTPRANSVV
jgi:hypothetical protein